MKNKIQLEGHVELVDQSFAVDYYQKGDYGYLVFYNEENEKVVLKFHSTELVMTRFSRPTTIMRFFADRDGEAQIPTPAGMQVFGIQTSFYQVVPGSISLAYQLHDRAGGVFARYQLEITWG